MILGLGIDLVQISRIEQILTKASSSFIRKTFTEKEIAYCCGRAPKNQSQNRCEPAQGKAPDEAERGVLEGTSERVSRKATPPWSGAAGFGIGSHFAARYAAKEAFFKAMNQALAGKGLTEQMGITDLVCVEVILGEQKVPRLA